MSASRLFGSRLRVLSVGAIAALALAGTSARAQSADSSPSFRPRTTAEDLQMFSQVLNQIRVNHPDSVDMHRLFMAAIEGMVRATDPHSFVIQAVRLNAEKRDAYEAGKLWPVPVAFQFIDGAPVVLSVSRELQSKGVDIIPGDELISADGRQIRSQSPLELEVELAGAKNTPVSLSFQRRRNDGTLVSLTRIVTRRKPEEESAVPAAFMLDSTTGYVRVTTFVSDNVSDELHSDLGKLEAQGMRRLILDLRDNGGGRVDQASKIAGEFLPSGALVYTAEGKKPEVNETVKVSRSFWRSERSYPIVLMVNGGTASASELVAGALQDHDRALIVGRPTFGKALLMGGFPLSDGSLIYLVIGHVKTPCGRVIQREYANLSTRNYYRLARADRDTAGRPSCHTDHGRTVFGGGGIYPDLVIDEAETPVWLSRVRENGSVQTWVGGYVSSNPAFISALSGSGTPEIPKEALGDFRSFSLRQGVRVPSDPETDALLRRVLLAAAARAKFGDAGYYRTDALLDPEVRAAASAFAKASAILGR